MTANSFSAVWGNIMKNKITLLAGLLLSAIASSWPATGHHSFSAEFTEDRGEIHGVVTSASYRNPHPRYQVEVTNEDGSQQTWELQASAVTGLRNAGWDRDFVQVGDEVTVQGALGRDGAKKMFIRGLTKANGDSYPRRTVQARDRNEVHATYGKNYGYAKLNPDAPFDISGPWRNSYRFRVTVDDLEPKPTPFTEEAREIYANTVHYDDYSLRCVAPALPRIFGAPYDMDIVDAGSHYQFVYIEHNTPRRIYMDGREVPENYPDRPMGYSVGRWDGNELVIETTKLAQGFWLDGSGLPMSGGDGTRIVERYTFAEDLLSMEREMTIYDDFYSEPLVRRRWSARDDYIMITEHDSCDPTSYYSDILEDGSLQRRLDEIL